MTAPSLTIDTNISCRQNILNLIIESNPKLKDINLNNVSITNYGENVNGSIEGDSFVEITGIPTKGFSGKYIFYYNRVSLKNWQLDDVVGCWKKRIYLYDIDENFKSLANYRVTGTLRSDYLTNAVNLIQAIDFKNLVLKSFGLHEELPLYMPWYDNGNYNYIYKCDPSDEWLKNNVRICYNVKSGPTNRPDLNKSDYTIEELNSINSQHPYPKNDDVKDTGTYFYNLMRNKEYYPFLLYKDSLWIITKVS